VNHLRRIAFLQRLRIEREPHAHISRIRHEFLGHDERAQWCEGVTRLSDEPVVAQTVVAAAASIEYIAVQVVVASPSAATASGDSGCRESWEY